MQPDRVFETSVGHFWGIIGTRDFMRARYALVEAILTVKTFDAAKAALDHTKDILRLNRSDNMGVPKVMPALLLRLDRDQECYDLVKWYATMGQEADYDWGDMSLPFLNVKNADAFESVNYMCGRFPDLSHVVAITLLKIRLLLSLTSLKYQPVVLGGFQCPREIVQDITVRLPDTTIVTDNRQLLDHTDHAAQIKQLTSQVESLYKTVRRANKHFWPGLLKPERHLQARPGAYSHGSLEEMQLILQHSIDAWVETPGALEVIKGRTLR